MGRRILMVMLGLGALAGFGAGFARACHGGWGPSGHGPGGGWGHRAAFEQRVADTCAGAALRVYGQRDGERAKDAAGPKP